MAKKTIAETLSFMERLREAFPCDKEIDYFGDYVKCDVREAAEKLNIPISEVWEYVSAACDAHLIDNNGGDLRFNNNLYEDLVEMMLLEAFHDVQHKVGNIQMGFIFKVIHNMYRGDNFCAGKLGDMNRINSMRTKDVLAEAENWLQSQKETKNDTLVKKQ